MNDNEAISKIRLMLDVGGSDGFTSSDKEALNMAINALTAEIAAPPKTNSDLIRQMTDEELAEFIVSHAKFASDVCQFYDKTRVDRIIEWLKQEVSGNDKV